MKRFSLAPVLGLISVALPVSSLSQALQTNGVPPRGVSQAAQSPETVLASVTAEGRVAEWMIGEQIPSIKGLPFSAKVELESVSQLQDGTQIRHETFNLDARDSAGRTRNEMRDWIATGGGEPALIRIELYDPATRTRTDLYPVSKLARQWAQNGPSQAAAPASAGPRPETTRTEMGTDTMQGLLVTGVRVIQTYPTGVLGNDRPLSIVTESWYSAELRINLLTKRIDPRYGEQTVRVTQLDRQEPDTALFTIGDEYKVVNEGGPTLVVQGPGATDEHATAGGGGTASLNSALPGIARPGVGGVLAPICVYCPNPSYTDEARLAKFSGSVLLQVVVTADGRTENMSVLRRAGYGLDQSALETVKTWQFRPGKGPDGNPVATVVPIEVSFHIK